MKTQLRFQNFIPVILLLAFSALLLGLFAIPHSQYALLGEMTALNSNITETGEPIALNWGTILPAIFTMFAFILLIVQFCFGVLSIFMYRLFTFRLVTLVSLISFSVELVLEVLYFAIGFNGKFNNGDSVLDWGNTITLIVNIVGYLSYIITYFIFIEKLFQDVKKGLKPYIQLQRDERKKERKEISQKDEVVNSEKFFMKNTIEKMVEQGKLTREEADKIIRELNDNNS